MTVDLGALHGICIDPATGNASDPTATPLLGKLMQAVVDLYDSIPNADAPCAWGIVGGAQINVERGGYVGTGGGGLPCAGMLTVRLISLTPASSFPGDQGGPIRDFDLSFGAHVEVGVWRPAPEVVETADGLVLPDLAEEQAAADQLALDAAIVRAALLDFANREDVPVILEAFLPWGPMGGVVGGATTAQFQIV